LKSSTLNCRCAVPSADNGQLNTYFEYLGENQYTCHIFAQTPCMDLGADKDEDMWKTAIYVPWLICDDNTVEFIFRNMVEDNIFFEEAG